MIELAIKFIILPMPPDQKPKYIDFYPPRKPNHQIKPTTIRQLPISNNREPSSLNAASIYRSRPIPKQPSLNQPQQDWKYQYSFGNRTKEPPKPNKPQKSKKRKLIKRLAIGVAVLAVIGIGVTVFYGISLNNLLKRVYVAGFSPQVGGTENILIAGSTTRCGLKFQSSQWGSCAQVGADENSDIIMIAHLNPATHSVSLLSIPRDTFVPNARSNNQSFKIDAALYQGPSQLVKAIEEDFGIPIQHYVEVNFDGFVNTVNAIGGIKMDFPMPVYDAYSHLNITQPGCVQLNGFTALQLIRARHLQYKPASITTNDKAYWPYEFQSDIGRIARTHEFMRVLAATILKKNLANPISDEKIVSSVLPNLIVDSGLNDSALLGLISEFHSSNIVNAPEYTLPIVTPPFGPYYFNGINYGDVVFPVEPTDQTIIDKFLNEPSNVNTMTGKALPANSSVTVNVMNGSGISGQASQIASGLTSLGFNVATIGNLTPPSIQAQETYVYYKSGDEAQAEAVAHQLSGYVVLAYNSKKVAGNAEVTVITGTATGVNAAPASASQTAAQPASTTTAQAAATVTAPAPSDGFSAPSNPQAGLTPWDPRACAK